ncbi:MAG: efflux RND transporter periplasmic adaptor subunit [Acidobacteriaceae bacterium]
MMRKRMFLLIAACAVLVLAAWLVLRARGNGRVEAAPEPAAARVATVERGSVFHVLALAGQFQPYQVVDVHPKVSGFIRSIKVDIGDRVRVGQTLAILEVPELQAQLEGTVAQVSRSQDEITRAGHEVAAAEAEFAALHADNDRLQQAAKEQPGLIAQQELDDARSKDLAASAKVDAAKAALSAAQGGAEVARADNRRVGAMAGYTNVVAPFSGVVTWRYADTGALIQSGTDSNNQALPIVKLAQSDLLRLRMPVPEDAVRYVKEGDTMQVRVDALNRSFTGKVLRFTRSVNFETRTMETEVDVENKDLSIDPGMYANTQLLLNHAENVLTIPVEALLLRDNRDVVYVVDSTNHVHQRNVEVGLRGSRLAEIKSGLALGDRVILGGQEKYQEGERVTPVAEKRTADDVTREAGSSIDLHEDGEEQ